jgi:hypothetical protein
VEPRPALADKRGVYLFLFPEAGVLDKPYSAKPAQRSSHTGPPHIGMSHSCEMVLVKKLELEATELNLKNNNHKVHTPALVYK